MDFTATHTVQLTGISRRSVNNIYLQLRLKIQDWTDKKPPLSRLIEVNESYFGPRIIPGKRGRGASDKTIVFGIVKPNGKVYTEIISDARKKML